MAPALRDQGRVARLARRGRRQAPPPQGPRLPRRGPAARLRRRVPAVRRLPLRRSPRRARQVDGVRLLQERRLHRHGPRARLLPPRRRRVGSVRRGRRRPGWAADPAVPGARVLPGASLRARHESRQDRRLRRRGAEARRKLRAAAAAAGWGVGVAGAPCGVRRRPPGRAGVAAPRDQAVLLLHGRPRLPGQGLVPRERDQGRVRRGRRRRHASGGVDGGGHRGLRLVRGAAGPRVRAPGERLPQRQAWLRLLLRHRLDEEGGRDGRHRYQGRSPSIQQGCPEAATRRKLAHTVLVLPPFSGVGHDAGAQAQVMQGTRR
ncbi:hypothetical protein PVAP13_9KG127385 [Panicum virgatum]|uniref:Uncharacterized protein n=1 Tax=Panicum virgatum TaxID=38727 RepID=A0A8T0NG09_PANVG|nr:hypothetical protein PVAP13_9KG127385 [Panicum virgatum]